MAEKKDSETGLMTFKGHLVSRASNTIYIGNPSDKYIVMLQLQNMQQIGEVDVATNVIVQLQHTDQSMKLKERVVKKTDKDGLYNAMDIGIIWLERALNEGKTEQKAAL